MLFIVWFVRRPWIIRKLLFWFIIFWRLSVLAWKLVVTWMVTEFWLKFVGVHWTTRGWLLKWANVRINRRLFRLLWILRMSLMEYKFGCLSFFLVWLFGTMRVLWNLAFLWMQMVLCRLLLYFRGYFMFIWIFGWIFQIGHIKRPSITLSLLSSINIIGWFFQYLIIFGVGLSDGMYALWYAFW